MIVAQYQSCLRTQLRIAALTDLCRFLCCADMGVVNLERISIVVMFEELKRFKVTFVANFKLDNVSLR